MARRSIEERLAQLDVRRQKLQARLAQRSRVQDTRRKILIGALVLQRLDASSTVPIKGDLRDWLTRELPGFLTRDLDKTLFADFIGETPPLASAPAATAPAREPQAA